MNVISFVMPSVAISQTDALDDLYFADMLDGLHLRPDINSKLHSLDPFSSSTVFGGLSRLVGDNHGLETDFLPSSFDCNLQPYLCGPVSKIKYAVSSEQWLHIH